MSSFDRRLNLAKGVIPALAMIVFVIARSGANFMVVPFVAIALLGIVQTVRKSGVIGGREFRGRVADSAADGRSRADEILGQPD